MILIYRQGSCASAGGWQALFYTILNSSSKISFGYTLLRRGSRDIREVYKRCSQGTQGRLSGLAAQAWFTASP
jgi:hypothetical protein